MPGVAVIGIGHWGKNHVRVYMELKQEGIVNAVKICDIDKSRVQQLSDTLGIEGVTDYRQILTDPEIRAVSIATPSDTHYSLGREFIEAGKDVLIEKPLTLNPEDAARLVEVANNNNRILMVGHIFRYHPAVQELKRRIDAGEFGEIQNIIGNRMFLGLPRRDMGVIYALGIHELDMFCYLLGVDYPKSLMAALSKSYGQDIEETAIITMDFGHARGYALESWVVPAYGKRRDLVVIGSQRSAKIDYLNPQELHIFDARIITKNGTPVRVEDEGERTISIPYAEPLKEEFRHFLSCISSRCRPLSDGLVGLRAIVMAEAALTSAATNKAVMLP